jgi:perosamine synthetase
MITQCEPLIGKAEKKAIGNYMDSGGFLTEYKQTEEFEKRLAKFFNVPYVSCVPSGSAALLISLLVSGVKPGDEVLVPDYTMVATAGAVRMIGATPVFVDVERNSLCMDVSKAKVTDKTKALIYVEINGRSGDIFAVKDFCRSNYLTFIEDSCQAFGSEMQTSEFTGDKLGTLSRFGCFSFSFHKLITTGQGGMIISHTDKDYRAIERWKDHGCIGEWRDTHDYFGFNFAYTDLQAVVGIAQLETVNERIEKKRNIHRWYFDKEPDPGYVPWFMEYYTEKRDDFIDYMGKQDITVRAFYPPIHTQKIYQDAYCPVAEEISKKGVWLPSSLTLTKKQVYTVKEAIKEYENK